MIVARTMFTDTSMHTRAVRYCSTLFPTIVSNLIKDSIHIFKTCYNPG